MNKSEALQKLASLEKETAQLRKIIEAPEELIGRITTYEQVCKELKETPIDRTDFSDFPEYLIPRLVAFTKIQQIAKLFNEGWIPNWTNHNEYKYYPWFETKGSVRFRFAYSGYLYDISLCAPAYYKSEEISDYVGKTFIDIYKELR